MEAEKEWLAEDGVDDAGTISVNTDIESNAETIYPARNIKIDRVQFSIFELKRRYDKGLICPARTFSSSLLYHLHWLPPLPVPGYTSL